MRKNLSINISAEDLAMNPCALYKKFENRMVRAFNWQAQTKDAYENYISQLKPFLRNTAFCECTSEDYDEAIEKINSSRAKKGDRLYAESTLKSIRSVVNDLCSFVEYYSHGLYYSTLWGSSWNKETKAPKKIDPIKEKQKRIDKQLKLPRSLTIPQEIKLLNAIEEKYLQDSIYLGIAVMFYMGLRPGECLGLQFGDIRPLEGYPEVQCMYIYEQLRADEERTNTLKTANAYRVLPIPTELSEMIEKRQAAVEAKIPGKSEKCYLICKDESAEGLLKQGQRKQFRLCCQSLLRKISVEEAVIANLQSLIDADQVAESTVTSYLLRRNFATALAAVCGMEDDELKYEMGHSLYESDEHRRDFLNPDTMVRLWEKLNRRSFHFSEEGQINAIKKEEPILLRQKTVSLKADEEAVGGKGVYLNVWNEYPNDYIRVEIQEGELSALKYRTGAEPVELKKAARVKIHREFAEAISKSRKKVKI